VLVASLADGLVKGHEIGMDHRQIDFLLSDGGADVAGDVEVEVIFSNLHHLDAARVAWLFLSIAVGVDDLGNVLAAELVLALSFLKVLCGVDEQHVIGFFALLEHQDAHRDARGVEEICGQADHGVDVTVVEQLSADALFGAATEENTVGKDDRHHPFFLQVVKTMQQESEVGGGLGG